MFLESLILHNFRCFSDLTVNFNNRLTVIVGGNGAGKSTNAKTHDKKMKPNNGKIIIGDNDYIFY